MTRQIHLPQHLSAWLRLCMAQKLNLQTVHHQTSTVLWSYVIQWFYEYYNKNKWVSDHSVEIMWIVFCVGIFHESAVQVKYPYQKQWTWSPQMITTNLFLFLCHTSIDWILILMVYVYNFKGFTGETAIS